MFSFHAEAWNESLFGEPPVKQSSVTLHVAKLLSGKLAIQGLGLITVPIMSRIYAPSHFGVLQIFDSFVKVALVLSCLCYDLAIPLSKNDDDTLHTLILSALTACVMSVLTLGGVAFGRTYLADWFHVPELRLFLWFLPLFVLLGGLRNCLNNWAARELCFGTIVSADLTQSSLEKSSNIFWGMTFGPSSYALFVGRIIGAASGIFTLFALLLRPLSPRLAAFHLRWSSLKEIAIRYKKFPIYSSASLLITTSSLQLPSWLLSASFSSSIVGHYAFGMRMIELPMKMVRLAMSQVLYPIMAQEYEKSGSLSAMADMFFLRLLQLSIFPTMAVVFLGPEIFRTVFGDKWSESGIYAQFIVIWACAAFLHIPLRVCDIVNRQEVSLIMNTANTISRTAGLLIAVRLMPPRTAIALFFLISAGCQMVNLFWKLRIANVSLFKTMLRLFQYVGIASLSVLPVKLAAGTIADGRLLLAMLGGMALCYGGALFWLDAGFRQFSRMIALKFKRKTS